MKTNTMAKRMIFGGTLLAIMAGGATDALADHHNYNNDHHNYNNHSTTTTTVTVTNATGAITQLNYDEDGNINGFLVGTNTLISFPTSVCGGIGTLGTVGTPVTYSGRDTTNNTTLFQTVTVTSFTGIGTYTQPTASTTFVPYPATTGVVGALNYDSEGNIDGFQFGSLLVFTGKPSAALSPLLVPGTGVTVAGLAVSSGACVTPLTVVEPMSLTFGTTIITLNGGHN